MNLSLGTLSENVMTAMKDLNKITDFGNVYPSVLLDKILDIFQEVRNERQGDLEKICHLLISNGLLELFIRLWDACHENSEEFYSQTDSSKFVCLCRIKSILWCYSDKCVELAEMCQQNGDVIERLMREFTIPQFDVSSLEQKPLRKMITANLGILHNLVRNDWRNRNHIRKNDGIEKILVYEKSTDPMIKAKIFIVLAYCINEDENEKITTGRGVIQFIIQELLSSAVTSPDHVAKISNHAFSAEETVMALNELASNDANTKAIVETGVLPLLTKLLDRETSSHSENLEAVNCIWSLAFHPEYKEKIIEEPGLIEGIKKLTVEFKSDKRMNKACLSVMFVLNPKQPTEVDERHIMISYNWEVKGVMLQLRDFLKKNGHSIWMDVDDMQGSILGAMAYAVENAALVIVAMTESYKNSNACRTEAEYAYKREIPILPLRMQADYVADGWLGALVGTKVYVNLSSGDVESKLEETRQRVAKLINSTKKPEKRIIPVVSSESTVAEERAANEHRVKMEIYDLKKKLLQRKLDLVEAEIAEKKN